MLQTEREPNDAKSASEILNGCRDGVASAASSTALSMLGADCVYVCPLLCLKGGVGSKQSSPAEVFTVAAEGAYWRRFASCAPSSVTTWISTGTLAPALAVPSTANAISDASA